MLTNIELECGIIGLMLTQNQLIDTIADEISADDFSEPLLGRLFDMAVTQFGQNGHTNPVSLKPYFEDDQALADRGGIGFLGELSGDIALQAALVPIRGQMADLKALAQRRRIRDALQKAAGWCDHMDVPIAEIVQEVDGAISEQQTGSIPQITGGDAIRQVLEAVDTQERGVSSGNSAIDNLLGPIMPQQFVVLAGRPGMGKTAVALSYSLGVASRGRGVLFVSLEMGARELGARMTADMCFESDVDLPYNRLRDGKLSPEQRQMAEWARDTLDKAPMQVVDTGSLDVARLENLVRRTSRQMELQGTPLGLVVIDYLQLLRVARSGASSYERISEVSRVVKGIAKDYKVGILALAQLSRNVEQRDDKRPIISDLRDSGQVEQDADKIMFLLREEYYLAQSEPDPSHKDYVDWQCEMADARGKIEFILSKRRDGRTGTSIGKFHGEYQAVRG